MNDVAIENRREEAARWWDEYSKCLEYSKEFGIATIRSLILINGGAVVAILATIGNIATKNDAIAKKLATAFGSTLLFFVVGLTLSVLAAGIGYSNYIFYTLRLPNPHKLQVYIEKGKLDWNPDSAIEAIDRYLMYAGILSAASAFLMFILGAFYSVKDLQEAFSS
jgi:hypothetical protein